jgi:hypothetical protein
VHGGEKISVRPKSNAAAAMFIYLIHISMHFDLREPFLALLLSHNGALSFLFGARLTILYAIARAAGLIDL